MRASRLLSLLAVAAALTAARAASADAQTAGVSPSAATADQKKQATDHFVAGKDALAAGDLERAATEFGASIAIVNSPNARLELARTLRDEGELEPAWEEYRRTSQDAFVLAATEARYTQTAEAAASERAELEKRVALVVVTVARPPAGAVLRVAGKIVPSAAWKDPVFVPPGPVEVALFDASGARLMRTTLTAPVGQTTPVSIEANVSRPDSPAASSGAPSAEGADVQASAPAAPVPAALQEPPPPSARSSWLRPLALVSAGVGVVGLGTFAVFGLLSDGIYNDLKNACPHGCTSDHHGEIDSGILDQTIANVGLAVGIAGAAVSATSFILDAKRKPASAGAALVVAPGYVGVRGSL